MKRFSVLVLLVVFSLMSSAFAFAQVSDAVIAKEKEMIKARIERIKEQRRRTGDKGDRRMYEKWIKEEEMKIGELTSKPDQYFYNKRGGTFYPR